MNQNPNIFIQFAGQGVKYMDELRRLYSTYPAIRPFIQQAIAEVKKQASLYDDSETGFFNQGLDIDVWIDRPDTTPDTGYLLSSPLSHPFIYLCQIANYISIIQEGIEPAKLLSRTHSATGFSTGVVAAIIVSMGLPLDKLYDIALKTQAMFFWQGVRCQQSILKFGVQSKLDESLLESPEGSPSCMASVNNLSQEALKEKIDLFSDYGIVHAAYELLPNRWIISGLPESLTAFRYFLKEHVVEAEWRFTPSTIAAHCPFLNHALETSPVDAERLGLVFKGNDMKIPVWSNDSGKDLRACENIIFSVMKAYFTRPAFWQSQIAPLSAKSDIKYVLDFGPGPGVASLTENYTSNSGIQVIRCTVPLGRRRLFEEVLPSLEAAT